MIKKSKVLKSESKEKTIDAAAILKSQVADNIKIFRKRAGLTQEQLSRTTKVSARYIAELERKGGQNLTLETLCRLSQALNVKAIDLINGEQALVAKKTDAIKLAIEALQLYCQILETGNIDRPGSTPAPEVKLESSSVGKKFRSDKRKK